MNVRVVGWIRYTEFDIYQVQGLAQQLAFHCAAVMLIPTEVGDGGLGRECEGQGRHQNARLKHLL